MSDNFTLFLVLIRSLGGVPGASMQSLVLSLSVLQPTEGYPRCRPSASDNKLYHIQMDHSSQQQCSSSACRWATIQSKAKKICLKWQIVYTQLQLLMYSFDRGISTLQWAMFFLTMKLFTGHVFYRQDCGVLTNSVMVTTDVWQLWCLFVDLACSVMFCFAHA